MSNTYEIDRPIGEAEPSSSDGATAQLTVMKDNEVVTLRKTRSDRPATQPEEITITLDDLRNITAAVSDQ